MTDPLSKQQLQVRLVKICTWNLSLSQLSHISLSSWFTCTPAVCLIALPSQFTHHLPSTRSLYLCQFIIVPMWTLLQISLLLVNGIFDNALSVGFTCLCLPGFCHHSLIICTCHPAHVSVFQSSLPGFPTSCHCCPVKILFVHSIRKCLCLTDAVFKGLQ